MSGKTDSLTVKIILRLLAVISVCLMMFWAGFSRPTIVIVGCILATFAVSFGLLFAKKPQSPIPAWKEFMSYFALMAGILVLGWVLYLMFTDVKPAMTIEERAKWTEERQLEFGMNAWFELADLSLPITNQWWVGTVRQQRLLVAGIYQTKVVRDDDNTLFLTLAGRELSPGERVEVGMFEHKAWQGSFPAYTHVVK